MARLLYQGHGSYRITTSGGKTVFVDPYIGEGYAPKADLVLVTHEHSDHNKISLLTCGEDTVMLRVANMLVEGEYRTETHHGVTVTAVPAQNKNHKIDQCVGFLIRVDSLLIYASGDTSKTDYMAEIGKLSPDYALLPMDGYYNMGPEEASECAAIIKARHTIPIHVWPSDKGLLFDRARAEELHCQGRLIVAAGEEIEL